MTCRSSLPRILDFHLHWSRTTSNPFQQPLQPAALSGAKVAAIWLLTGEPCIRTLLDNAKAPGLVIPKGLATSAGATEGMAWISIGNSLEIGQIHPNPIGII